MKRTIIYNILIAVVAFVIWGCAILAGEIWRFNADFIYLQLLMCVISLCFIIVNRDIFKDLNIFIRYSVIVLSSAALTALWFFISTMLIIFFALLICYPIAKG